MKVWTVTFQGQVHDYEHCFPDTRLMGIYDSRDKADEAVRECKEKYGDEDECHYDDFDYIIEEYELNENYF